MAFTLCFGGQLPQDLLALKHAKVVAREMPKSQARAAFKILKAGDAGNSPLDDGHRKAKGGELAFAAL
jgi:hypothetical protein